MAINEEKYRNILSELAGKVQLVAVSKTKPAADVQALYELGQRDFGENYVQELTDKQGFLPADIRWHFIGHLQSNKVKYIAPFVYLIHGVDSLKLLQEINRQGARHNRVIDCLLQIHIAREETKFGLDAGELKELLQTIRPENRPADLPNVRIRGLMGMASFTSDTDKVRAEFRSLKTLFDTYFPGSAGDGHSRTDGESILSMGMSGDYQLAITEGSTMVRIGSLLFGARN